jgi:two-component system phosphate regulon sensor histidine kinase PhoR
MNGQVEKVLQMAMIEKNNINLNLAKIDLNEIINQAVGNIAIQVEKAEGEIQTFLNAEDVIIEGDQTHISNIVYNLLDNAIKYSPENPLIQISTKNVNEGIEIVVKDNGIGISKEARKHIFDKFYRVHTGNLHDVKGFGLGLSYVKAMTLAHHGKLDVTSELGKGSSFIIVLPFKQS